jgi:hypothetical protein
MVDARDEHVVDPRQLTKILAVLVLVNLHPDVDELLQAMLELEVRPALCRFARGVAPMHSLVVHGGDSGIVEHSLHPHLLSLPVSRLRQVVDVGRRAHTLVTQGTKKSREVASGKEDPAVSKTPTSCARRPRRATSDKW